MDEQFHAELKSQMAQVLEITKNDLATIRSGRATPALVEHIVVTTYGGTQKLKVREVATITTSDAKTILIHPFDSTTRDDIVKGIQEANTGLSPIAEGNDIRINIPSLSEDRRKEYIKLAHAKLEAGRIMIRQVRHDQMMDLKRAIEKKEITEDQEKHYEKLTQQVTDEMMAEIDRIGEAKEKELMQI